MAVVFYLDGVKIKGKGEIQPFVDENGRVVENSVAERVFLDINGAQNGLIIRGKDMNNPVLLFISGGPGVPQYWLNEYYDNSIEEEFTVCWWDYYGECLSYDKEIQKEEITLERLKSDAGVVTEYLKKRFGQCWRNRITGRDFGWKMH